MNVAAAMPPTRTPGPSDLRGSRVLPRVGDTGAAPASIDTSKGAAMADTDTITLTPNPDMKAAVLAAAGLDADDAPVNLDLTPDGLAELGRVNEAVAAGLRELADIVEAFPDDVTAGDHTFTHVPPHVNVSLYRARTADAFVSAACALGATRLRDGHGQLVAERTLGPVTVSVRAVADLFRDAPAPPPVDLDAVRDACGIDD